MKAGHNIQKITNALLEKNASGPRALPVRDDGACIPIHDKAHVYQAIGRFGMFRFATAKECNRTARRIAEAADKFGIKYRKKMQPLQATLGRLYLLPVKEWPEPVNVVHRQWETPKPLEPPFKLDPKRRIRLE